MDLIAVKGGEGDGGGLGEDVRAVDEAQVDVVLTKEVDVVHVSKEFAPALERVVFFTVPLTVGTSAVGNNRLYLCCILYHVA